MRAVRSQQIPMARDIVYDRRRLDGISDAQAHEQGPIKMTYAWQSDNCQEMRYLSIEDRECDHRFTRRCRLCSSCQTRDNDEEDCSENLPRDEHGTSTENIHELEGEESCKHADRLTDEGNGKRIRNSRNSVKVGRVSDYEIDSA